MDAYDRFDRIEELISALLDFDDDMEYEEERARPKAKYPHPRFETKSERRTPYFKPPKFYPIQGA